MRIKLTKEFEGSGPMYAGMTPGDVMVTVAPPAHSIRKTSIRECWVEGVGEPVKLRHYEFTVQPR